MTTHCAARTTRKPGSKWTAAQPAAKPVAAACRVPKVVGVAEHVPRQQADRRAAHRGLQVAVAGVAPVVEVVAAEAGLAAAVVVVADGIVEMERTNMKNITTLFRIAAVAGAIAMTPQSWAQATYPTPEAAANALVDGIARHDNDAVKAVIGSNYREFIPAGATEPEDITAFLDAWSQAHAIVPDGADKAYLGAGRYGWTLPIPIVKTASGWHFDTVSTPETMRVRRIGRNELAAIQVALAYTDAQEEYKLRDWDGNGVKEYARRGISSAGKHDGLYWASLPGEAESPLGPDFADAKPGQPYHGYLYKILTAQGKDAKGGAKSYIKNGHMTEGYALVAWPAKYDDTGVMSFIVNQDGVVYQKNLGANTVKVAPAMTTFNPDATWQKVEPTK